MTTCPNCGSGDIATVGGTHGTMSDIVSELTQIAEDDAPNCGRIRYRAAAEIARLREELANGSAEVRRSVEANGFEWQEGESAVWHAVTAIGLYRGTIDSLREENERLRRRLEIAEAALTERDDLRRRNKNLACSLADAVEGCERLRRQLAIAEAALKEIASSEAFPSVLASDALAEMEAVK